MTLTHSNFADVFATDAEFDVLLPTPERRAAARYWTPVAVAARAAQLLARLGARRVLDVGSGPGKFCIVSGARAPNIELVGIEQRPQLVAIAERVAREAGIRNVSFRVGDVTQTSWSEFDALYVFNSFAENIYAPVDRFDSSVELSRERYIADVLLVARKLVELPRGGLLVTYHGLGGPIPDAYRPLHAEPSGNGSLHVWRHDSPTTNETFWLEDGVRICRVTISELQRILHSVEHDET